MQDTLTNRAELYKIDSEINNLVRKFNCLILQYSDHRHLSEIMGMIEPELAHTQLSLQNLSDKFDCVLKTVVELF